jgi:Flp pilus assembly protein protease CpaA
VQWNQTMTISNNLIAIRLIVDFVSRPIAQQQPMVKLTSRLVLCLVVVVVVEVVGQQ